MSEERLDRKSRLGEAEGMCFCSGDSHDDDVVHKRRKMQYQDGQEAECGVQLVEREEEKMQQLGAELYPHDKKVEDIGEKGKEVGEKEERVGVGEKEEKVEVGEKEEEVEEVARKEEGIGEVGKQEEVGEEAEKGEEESWGGNGEEISASSWKRQIKEMSIDRLSAFPDSLLIHILSFLDFREAVVASVLSKRWRFLWTDLPKLVFDGSDCETYLVPNFVLWVHRTLIICGGNYLQKFKVCLNYEERFAWDVSTWVEFVLKNKVKNVALHLIIDYLGKRCTSPQYKLPELMYSNSCLTKLSLKGCIIDPRRAIEWRSLAKLSLEEIELTECIIEKIQSSCPVLYELTLEKCWGLDCLEVKSQSLHVLAIEFWNKATDFGHDVPLLKISAPYVHSLTIRLRHHGRKMELTNIPLVVRATIDFDGHDCAGKLIKVKSYTNELFESLQHVKDLEVDDGYIEVLSMLAETGWRLPQSGRERLTVNPCSDEYCIPGIVCLLESSPNLETFIINSEHIVSQSHKACFPNGLTASYFKKADLNSDLMHLKTVNISRFVNVSLCGEPMLTMAKLLLKRATALEKMDIYFQAYDKYWQKHALRR